MKKAALISVSCRDGILELARDLQEMGYVLLTTSGTGRFLSENGIQSTAIEQYSGQREIMDGRVKTLHPRIYAGLLARRDHSSDMQELEQNEILPIDVAAVNLYPFSANLSKERTLEEMVELIDVGGPSMIRAAAKNFRFVLPLIDPADYQAALSFLRTQNELSPSQALAFRQRLAVKVFGTLARDCIDVGSYFSRVDSAGQPEAITLGTVRTDDTAATDERQLAKFPDVTGTVLVKSQSLRYGENPHQTAAFYVPLRQEPRAWEQLGGKELSYNNLLDLDATVRMLRSLPAGLPAAIIVKHLNPCGAARALQVAAAIRQAKRCDPRSHFGGIIGCNECISLEAAQEVRGDFAEILVAPDFSPEALEELRRSKNLRIVRYNFSSRRVGMELRSALEGILVQQSDGGASLIDSAQLMTVRGITDSERADLQLAWALCAHVRSNAITVVKDGTLLAVGAGQMSRIDSVEVALMKARQHEHDLQGAVAASDAFFPFPDSVVALAAAGVSAIVAPSGAKRDTEAVAAADQAGISLLFVSDRHFRH